MIAIKLQTAFISAGNNFNTNIEEFNETFKSLNIPKESKIFSYLKLYNELLKHFVQD